MRALARHPLSVPALQLDGGQALRDPLLDRPPFIFAPGVRQASSPDGGTRPVVMCTVINVNANGSTITDHCLAPEHPAKRS